jgi:uncharacterized repeat protein (TIGR01451 family)
MYRYMPTAALQGALWLTLLALEASGQGAPSSPAAPGSLDIKTIAEVELRTSDNGRDVVKLVPADRLVPGDQVVYTLQVRNSEAAAVAAPTVTNPIPEHMVYVVDSAVGPGATVSYSVDGGHSFNSAANLTVQGPDGRPRPAAPADYTHIRWQFKNSLKGNSVAFVRFRAVVK